TDIRVELGEGNMQRYALPAPREDPREIARILFSLLELAPKNKALGVSLFCCVIRAVFGECLPTDFTLFLSGKSGSQKSECAALALGCFGKFNARNFPANFTDTDSDLEYKAHQAKDSVFVIDDYVPGINLIEANKTRCKGANIIRGAGNQAGRGRRNTDMSGKSAYFSRGMNIITGEDSTAGSSLIARQLIIEIKQGDVNLSFLTALQLNSSRGELAACMATFIKWLAPKMDELKKTYPEQVRDTRDKALQEKFVSSHARAGDIYASLYTAANIYIDYAVEVGAIGDIRANDLAEMIENSLKDAVRAQCAFQMQSDEVERFLDLVRAGFSSGECHVCDVYKQGPPLQSPHVWGWHSPTEDADPVGCGQLIG
ncbi:MAG: cell wall-binding protein, partial [Deltaproteobacteria bacterium]